jgi:hypothetical protein
MNASFMGIELTEREVAALAALGTLASPATGNKLASTMRLAGRATSPAAAHQAGAALAREGLAVKGTLYGTAGAVGYEITSTGREWIALYRRLGGRP